MKITVIVTDSGDAHIPDGTTLVFDADKWQVSTPSDIEDITCADAGCDGCSAVHRRFTGRHHLTLEASGSERATWTVPEMFMIGTGEPVAHASGLEVLRVSAEGAAGDAR